MSIRSIKGAIEVKRRCERVDTDLHELYMMTDNDEVPGLGQVMEDLEGLAQKCKMQIKGD